ncbi:hypothetical protein ACXC9Q_38800 (plasmid) [Kribbella sp. CWNU-51]
MGLTAVLELYGLPPEQFTAARNQLANTLRDAGDATGSASVKALRKPSVAAWLANRLVRIAPEQIAELTEFGDQLREAHSTADRDRLKRLTPRRHAMVQRLIDTARADTTSTARTITPTAAQRLAETLDAALVDPGAAQLLRSGCLTSALRHVGFGVVDESGEPAAVAAVPKKTSRPTPAVRMPARKAAPSKKSATTRKTTQQELLRRQRAELQDSLRQVEADYAEAEETRRASESELDANEHHIADMQMTIERLTGELEQTRRELRQAQGRTRKLERAPTHAARAAAAATRRRDAQQQRLEAFNK